MGKKKRKELEVSEAVVLLLEVHKPPACRVHGTSAMMAGELEPEFWSCGHIPASSTSLSLSRAPVTQVRLAALGS